MLENGRVSKMGRRFFFEFGNFPENREEFEIWFRERSKSFFKMFSFYTLPMGWDGYEAKSIPQNIIMKTVKLLKSLNMVQPKIFPAIRESIQIEFENHKGEEAEIEVFFDRYEVSIFREDICLEEKTFTDLRKLKPYIKRFLDYKALEKDFNKQKKFYEHDV